MKSCEICGKEIFTRDGENKCLKCEEAKPVELKKRRATGKARDEAMRSLGLTKVRGALGGVYWE